MLSIPSALNIENMIFLKTKLILAVIKIARPHSMKYTAAPLTAQTYERTNVFQSRQPQCGGSTCDAEIKRALTATQYQYRRFLHTVRLKASLIMYVSNSCSVHVLRP